MMSLTEVLGFALALLMVGCSIRELHWSWPLAIASSVLYFFVFRDSQLYAQAGLQLVFALLGFWGWRQWLQRDPEQRPVRVIQRLPLKGWWLMACALAMLWPSLAWLLMHYTDSDVAWWDALPTALSLIGQALLGRKYLENWAVWLVVNVISVGLFAYKGLWLTCALYALFVVLSLAGWRQWHARLREPTA